MHELSITQSVVDAVCDRAAGRTVHKVTVRVGALTAVVPEAMLFCFDLVTDGTVAALRMGASIRVHLAKKRGTVWSPLVALQDSRYRPAQASWPAMRVPNLQLALIATTCARPISNDFTMNSRSRALASPWFAWNLCA